MHTQVNLQRLSKHLIFDAVFSIASVVVAVITAFSVLITGIFADSNSPTAASVGLSVILAGPMVLLLIIVAGLASRACTARGGKSARRTAISVTMIIYCIGAPGLVYGAWQCVQLLLPVPVYQETAVVMPYPISPL